MLAASGVFAKGLSKTHRQAAVAGGGATPQTTRAAPGTQRPCALIGGGGRGDTGGRGAAGGRGGGLIIPGPGGGRGLRQEEGFRRGGQLYDPTQRSGAPGGPRIGGGLVGEGLQMPGQDVAPTYNKYRPPPGFAQDEQTSGAWSELDKKLKAMDANQLLDMVSSKAGYWHTIGKAIPILNRQGFDSKLLEDITGIDSRTQNEWMMSAAVYDSLAMSGQFTEQELSHFNDMERGARMLSEFRFASEAELRIPSAKYIVSQKYGWEEATVLARAVKDFDRRSDEERKGFEYTPPDCLALKYYRDAAEQWRSNNTAAQKALAKALSIAGISEGARERMERLPDGDSATTQMTEEEAPSETPKYQPPAFEYVRFDDNEISYRPIAVAGKYGEADAAAVNNASTTSQSTSFNFFSETGAGHQWMVMPQWRAVAFTKKPYALYIPETSEVKELAKDQHDALDHEVQREGSAVILVDRASKSISENRWYILPGPTGIVELTPGPEAAQRPDDVLGEVVIIVRPPKRTVPQGANKTSIQM